MVEVDDGEDGCSFFAPFLPILYKIEVLLGRSAVNLSDGIPGIVVEQIIVWMLLSGILVFFMQAGFAMVCRQAGELPPAG